VQEREEESPIPVEAEALHGDALQAAGGGLLGCQRLGERCGETVEDVERRREVEIVLGLEIAVDRAFSDPGVGGDLVDQNAVEGLPGEDLRRRVENRSLLGFGLDSRHGYSGTDQSVLYHIRQLTV
jgi:hypothetical protein